MGKTLKFGREADNSTYDLELDCVSYPDKLYSMNPSHFFHYREPEVTLGEHYIDLIFPESLHWLKKEHKSTDSLEAIYRKNIIFEINPVDRSSYLFLVKKAIYTDSQDELRIKVLDPIDDLLTGKVLVSTLGGEFTTGFLQNKKDFPMGQWVKPEKLRELIFG